MVKRMYMRDRLRTGDPAISDLVSATGNTARGEWLRVIRDMSPFR
jgi:hypothetical protein